MTIGFIYFLSKTLLNMNISQGAVRYLMISLSKIATRQNYCLLPGRISSEQRYMLASATPSAYNKPSDMFFPVQLMAFTHQ